MRVLMIGLMAATGVALGACQASAPADAAEGERYEISTGQGRIEVHAPRTVVETAVEEGDAGGSGSRERHVLVTDVPGFVRRSTNGN